MDQKPLADCSVPEPQAPSAGTAPASPASRHRELWANADFLKLWTAQAISELGSRITREGIPLTALLVLHAGAVRMGLLNALGGLAVLAFGLAAGVWIDRLRRRPVMIAAGHPRMPDQGPGGPNGLAPWTGRLRSPWPLTWGARQICEAGLNGPERAPIRQPG
jgi:hypothetical protein